MRLTQQVGELVVFDERRVQGVPHIEIYDEYRE
jgi:hypothetical protein